MATLRRFLPTGEVRSIWDDNPVLRTLGTPHRGGNVEVVESGPMQGKFFVDFLPLAETTGRGEFAVCLVETFDNRGDAVKAEQAWLNDEWVKEGLPCCSTLPSSKLLHAN